MAARKVRKAENGWHKAEAAAPEPLDLEVGDSVEGVLGPVRASTRFPGRSYRLLRTADGTFFLNQYAALEQLGVFELPVGTEVKIVRTKDRKIAGQPNPMRGFDVYLKSASAESEGDLPF